MVSFLSTVVDHSGLICLTLGTFIIFLASRISFKEFRSLFAVIFFMGIFYGIVLGRTFTAPLYFWQGYWSEDGLRQAGVMVWRISLVFFLTRLFMAVTSPSEQGLSIAWFFMPFTRITPKAADFSLLISLTLRFIPLAMAEGGLLYKARVAKGDFPTNMLLKIAELANFIFAMVRLTLRRAEELAENLSARGYVSGNYRVLSTQAWQRQDSLAAAVLIAWGAFTLYIQLFFQR